MNVNRNKYLVIGFVVMSFNSLYQYSWNALEPLLKSGLNASVVSLSLGFTLFSIFSSVFQPIGGHFADRDGPRIIGLIASLLSALGFIGTYLAPSIYYFYVFWTLGSIGEGILYGIAANLAMKWFRDSMGFATGLVSMGFGIGSAVANPFIAMAPNYKVVTLTIGLIEVIVLPVLLWFSEYPPKLSGHSPGKVILSGKFWLIYVSFAGAVVPLMVASSELTVVGKGLPYSEIVALISILPLLSGGLRPFFGFVADKLGILRTAVLLNGLLVVSSLLLFMGQVAAFTVITGLAGGSLITLYFNVSGEIFGTRFSTVNSGLLYTAKALGGVLGSYVFSLLLVTGILYAEAFTIACSLLGITSLLPVMYASRKMKISVAH